jgi:hypothetical protein
MSRTWQRVTTRRERLQFHPSRVCANLALTIQQMMAYPRADARLEATWGIHHHCWRAAGRDYFFTVKVAATVQKLSVRGTVTQPQWAIC